MSIDATALPSELLVAPQPLIGFYGLDPSKNPIHKSIWDAFNNNRKADRAAVQFKILTTNYEFPVAKPKRASYEWYHPKGILKRNWMLKHLHVLPSVVVLFQDIEWNDPQWTEKQLQCASTIQSLKNSLQERQTRVALVLLQKAAPLPVGEDMLASERGASLANACAISNKMIFVLPHSDHLMGYTLRMESAFLEMSQSYYALMSKRVRSHRDQLTAAHTTLKIRHQFKLGFIAETRLDYQTGLKHYIQAYLNLEEIRIVDTNCLEIKTIAGFINYKVCRLMFKLNMPRDSINHFICHIDKYKNRIGFKELLFEHYAWLSTQHSAFAELFCEAIKSSLPALQTQHPGIYFHKASEYTAKRREAFMQCSTLSLSPTEPYSSSSPSSPSSVSLFSEYFGQRLVKTSEPFSDQQIISLVLQNEKAFNHSNVIICLLSQAMAQFKVYKCSRFRKKLATDMAEEYYRCGIYTKALTLFSLMLPDYREEKWDFLFSDILLRTLRCSFLSASVSDFITCSIEALSPKIRSDYSGRMLVLENLGKVFKGLPPVSESQIAPEIRNHWETALASFKSPIKIDLDKFKEIFECVVSFEKPQIKNEEVINIKLVFRILTDVSFRFRYLTALLTDGNEMFKLKALKYARFKNLKELRENEFNSEPAEIMNFDQNTNFEPEFYYKFIFTTDSQQFHENIQLQVSQIEIDFGGEQNYVILTKNPNISRRSFKHYEHYKDLIDNVNMNSNCYIVPTFHLTTQTKFNLQPMLVNEYFHVTCTISNSFNIFLQSVGLCVSVPTYLKNKVFLTTDTSTSRHKLHSQIQIDIGDLSSKVTTTVSFYIFSLIETTIELQQHIWYHIESNRPKSNTSEIFNKNSNDNSPSESSRPIVTDIMPQSISSNIRIDFIDDKKLKKTKEEIINIACINEFKFVGRFYTLNRQPLMKVYRGENFLYRANIEIQSPSDIDIIETYFICDHNLVQSTYSCKRKKHTNTYKSGESLEDVIVLRTNSSLDDWITPRDYEQSKTQSLMLLNRHRNHNKAINSQLTTTATTANIKHDASFSNTGNSSVQNKSLLSKIPTNMTIIGNNSLLTSQNSNLSSSTISDDGKLKSDIDGQQKDDNYNSFTKSTPKLILNKAIEALQRTGHYRGFIKGILTVDASANSTLPVFGVYCIKWRRNGCKEENESKFVINGMDIEEPPLNIYCSIEEKMFVKVPMTLKVVLKNPSAKIIHLFSTLNVSNLDNFMCSGHKQLNTSIFAYSENELVFNLYPLKVGWQTLPELLLEYNLEADPSKDYEQNKILSQLVQRSMPKKVFVLPPSKQQQQQHLPK